MIALVVAAPFLAASAPAQAIPASASAPAAQAWLALLDAENWAQSWQQAGAVVHERVVQQGWIDAVSTVRKPLGAVVTRTLTKVTKAAALPGAPPGTYEILEFRTDFAGRSGTVETVVMAGEPSGWKVDGYFIR